MQMQNRKIKQIRLSYLFTLQQHKKMELGNIAEYKRHKEAKEQGENVSNQFMTCKKRQKVRR